MVNKKNMESTTIRLDKSTKEILDSLKIIERESYDGVILRILEDLVENQFELNDSTKSLLDKRMENLTSGKVLSIQELVNKVEKCRKDR